MTHPVISRRRQENPGGVIGGALRGFASQKPRRMLRSVIRAESEGTEPSPIWGDAAAPEMAIAVARSTGLRFVFQHDAGLYSTAVDPTQFFEKRKKSPFLSRSTSLVLDDRFTV